MLSGPRGQGFGCFAAQGRLGTQAHTGYNLGHGNGPCDAAIHILGCDGGVLHLEHRAHLSQAGRTRGKGGVILDQLQVHAQIARFDDILRIRQTFRQGRFHILGHEFVQAILGVGARLRYGGCFRRRRVGRVRRRNLLRGQGHRQQSGHQGPADHSTNSTSMPMPTMCASS